MVWFSNSRFICFVLCTRPTIWMPGQYIRKQDGIHLFIYLFIYLARERQIDLQMFWKNAGSINVLTRVHVLHNKQPEKENACAVEQGCQTSHGIHLSGIQLVGLSGIQMAFGNIQPLFNHLNNQLPYLFAPQQKTICLRQKEN